MTENMLTALSLCLDKLPAADLQNVAGTSSILRKLATGSAQRKLNHWQSRINSNDPKDRYRTD